MNIQQIEYILALSEVKNFGKAAEKCFITQSTLSTMVARFEKEIGVTIFDRKNKPITITREGEQIIQQLKIISKEIHNLEEVVGDLKGELRGVLKIGVIPTIAPYLLPLFLNDFISKFPEIHFVVSELTTEQVLEKIERRDLDIGLVSTPLNRPNVVEIPLYNEPFMIYDKANEQPSINFKIQDIDFDRLWLLEEGHCMRTQMETICDLRKKRPQTNNLDYKSGTIDTLLKFVRINNGLTLIPYLATLDFSESERLHLKSLQAPVPARTVGLITHQHFVKKGLLASLQTEIQHHVKPLIKENNLNLIHPT